MSNWLYKITSIVYQCVNNIEIPKVIFYGCEKEHEIYFMELLFNLGFDVLYVNTKELQNLSCKNKIDSISKKIEYEKKSDLPEFPKKERVVSYETNALKAQNEVNELYYDGQSALKPWQLQKCSTRNIPLKITYDELFTLWSVDSNMRPQFKVQNNIVYIPNLCCKINGVESNVKEFARKINELGNVDNCLIFENKSLFSMEQDDYDYKKRVILQSNIRDMINDNGQLDRDKIKNSQIYHYSYLNPYTQNILLDIIESLIETALEKNKQKALVDVLVVLLNIDKGILNLLQNFDYGFKIPKIILYHSDSSTIGGHSKIILRTLNRIGFDILAVTPTRYCDIDDIFDENILNIFQLEDSAMNLRSPFKENKVQEKKSWFERIF